MLTKNNVVIIDGILNELCSEHLARTGTRGIEHSLHQLRKSILQIRTVYEVIRIIIEYLLGILKPVGNKNYLAQALCPPQFSG